MQAFASAPIGAWAAALTLVAAGVGCIQFGASQAVAVAASKPAPGAPYLARGDDALAQAESRVGMLVDRLAERLNAQPGDADGWHTLARAYASFGRHAAAIEAFRRALRLRPNEATLLAEYAASVAALDPHAVPATSTSAPRPPR